MTGAKPFEHALRGHTCSLCSGGLCLWPVFPSAASGPSLYTSALWLSLEGSSHVSWVRLASASAYPPDSWSKAVSERIEGWWHLLH